MTLDWPTMENPGSEGLKNALSRVVSELTTALNLVVRAEERGQTVRDLVAAETEFLTELEDAPAGVLVMATLELSFRALERLDVRLFEASAYCDVVDPPSPYFRLGDVETCSHRPDHPRLVP